MVACCPRCIVVTGHAGLSLNDNQTEQCQTSKLSEADITAGESPDPRYAHEVLTLKRKRSFSSSSHRGRHYYLSLPLSPPVSIPDQLPSPTLSTTQSSLQDSECKLALEYSMNSTRQYHIPYLISHHLDDHLIFLDNKTALERYPSFRDSIKAIVNPARQSGIRDNAQEKEKQEAIFRWKVSKYSGHKRTFLAEVLPLIVREECTPSQLSAHHMQSPLGKTQGYTNNKGYGFHLGNSHQWKRYGLICGVETSFTSDIVSARIAELGPQFQGHFWRLGNPTPDRTYTFNKKFFAITIPRELHLSSRLLDLFGLCPRGLTHPSL